MNVRVSMEYCEAPTKVLSEWPLSIFTTHLNKNTMQDMNMCSRRAVVGGRAVALCGSEDAVRDHHVV